MTPTIQVDRTTDGKQVIIATVDLSNGSASLMVSLEEARALLLALDAVVGTPGRGSYLIQLGERFEEPDGG